MGDPGYPGLRGERLSQPVVDLIVQLPVRFLHPVGDACQVDDGAYSRQVDVLYRRLLQGGSADVVAAGVDRCEMRADEAGGAGEEDGFQAEILG